MFITPTVNIKQDDPNHQQEIIAAAGLLIVWSNVFRRYQDRDSGSFITRDSTFDQMRRQVAATFNPLESLTRQLFGGKISLAQWEKSTAKEIKNAHLAQSLFAIGGKSNMSLSTVERLKTTLHEQFNYLSRFAHDIASGKVSEEQAVFRIKQYGMASQQSFWNETKHVFKLINWVLGDAEHCPDCLVLAANGPYTPDNLPTVPGAGDTQCYGNCKCMLVDIGTNYGI